MTSTEHQLLPAGAYYEQDWFDREQVDLFGRTWRFVGMADEWPENGSYRSVQLGNHPIAVLRDHDGVLRALHNVCRHRGVAVLAERGVVGKAIVCPYHNWTYGLDGCLLATPQRKELQPPPDRSTLGLRASDPTMPEASGRGGE